MKKWKDAASMLLAASTSPSFVNAAVFSACDRDYKESLKEKPDFQILALKKSSESPLLPGSYVFPGGTVNVADSSDEWIQLFKKFGYCVDTLCKSLNNNNTKLPLFEDTFNSLPRCISLRITAIREAFEECGILLCNRSVSNINKNNIIPLRPTSKHLIIDQIDTWREKVLKNPNEFINLCRYNNCYPDVTSLYLWSNWLTPSNIPTQFRFDSVFFISFLDSITYATQDNYEIESVKWITGIDLLAEFSAGISKLHYPQFYEVSRIATVNSFSNLKKIAVEINGMESERWMPVRIFAKEGEISLLPGDEMYPKIFDYVTPNAIFKENTSIDKFKCHQMNRMITLYDKPDLIKVITANMQSRTYRHILPWQPDSIEDLHGHL